MQQVDINELINSIQGLNVLIIGPPGSGKTTLSNAISLKGHKVIHTDDYIKHGYEESISYILNETGREHKTIIEGVQGYRLLRHGYSPDLVIEVTVSDATMKKIERQRGKEYSSFIKANSTILNEYLSKVSKKPKWITIQNNYL